MCERLCRCVCVFSGQSCASLSFLGPRSGLEMLQDPVPFTLGGLELKRDVLWGRGSQCLGQFGVGSGGGEVTLFTLPLVGGVALGPWQGSLIFIPGVCLQVGCGSEGCSTQLCWGCSPA